MPGSCPWETGLRQQTLSRWLQDACSLSVMPPQRQTKAWSIDEKIRVLAKAGSLTGAALTEFLEREGLRLAEYEQWRLALAEAAALLVLKKSEPPVGGRGRRYRRGERAVILAALGEAQTTGTAPRGVSRHRDLDPND